MINELHLLVVKVLEVVHGSVDGREKRFGVVAARLDDGGVVRGGHTVESI